MYRLCISLWVRRVCGPSLYEILVSRGIWNYTRSSIAHNNIFPYSALLFLLTLLPVKPPYGGVRFSK